MKYIGNFHDINNIIFLNCIVERQSQCVVERYRNYSPDRIQHVFNHITYLKF